ncbi:MAG: cytochrome c [Calditrichaeota bacterium]|nr:MAG: cytochrome c [Calditrichota bacterium]
MRYGYWVIIGCLALWVACRQSPSSTPAAPESTGETTGDTVAAIDPWKYYSYEERWGKRLYDHYCAVCHGENGEGDGFNAYNLDPRPHSLADSAYMAALSDKMLREVIAFGGRGVNKSVLMPAYRQTLTPEQIDYVIAYIRTFTKKKSEIP